MAQSLRAIRALFGWLALAVGLYFAAGWVGSSVPVNRDFVSSDAPDAVTVIVTTNGVHTTIAMPLNGPDMDWSDTFPTTDTADPFRPYTHVAVSWGEKAVFLNTPTWADLSPLTVLRIVGLGGEPLYHVEFWVRPAPSPDFRPLRISREQYRRLVRAIVRDLPPPGPGRRAYGGYAEHDVFYDARGSYTAYATCNEWIGETLRMAGIRTGAWTPFPGGVMKWVPPISDGSDD